MKPKLLIVANWKMNPQTLDEAREILDGVKEGIKDIKGVEIVICPPFLYLPYWVEFFSKNEKKIKLGAQDLFWEEKGAFTGEISPLMLKNFGCEYVIVGHSERRALAETDQMINKKIKAALKAKLTPILCIGETENERKQGKINQVLKNQLEKDLKSILNLKPSTRAKLGAGLVPGSKILNLIVAYEPVWAIGTGNPCYPEDAKKVLLFLRKLLKKAPILYGGSVNSQNAASYIREGNFNGLLVGGASLNAQEFIEIVKNVSKFKLTNIKNLL